MSSYNITYRPRFYHEGRYGRCPWCTHSCRNEQWQKTQTYLTWYFIFNLWDHFTAGDKSKTIPSFFFLSSFTTLLRWLVIASVTLCHVCCSLVACPCFPARWLRTSFPPSLFYQRLLQVVHVFAFQVLPIAVCCACPGSGTTRLCCLQLWTLEKTP